MKTIRVFGSPKIPEDERPENHILLADPNDEEERLGTGNIVIMIQGDNISSIHKPGGSPINEQQLATCFTKAKEHAKHLQELLRAAFNASPER